MTKTALLTLGRLFKSLDIARALAAAGWRVIIAEPERWHLTGVSRAVTRNYRVPSPVQDEAAYLNALLDICTRESVDLVIPVSEECIYATGIAGRLPAGTRLFSMPRERLRALHDKWRFVQRCRALGLNAPETALLSDPAAQALADGGPVILKGVSSCSGIGLQRLPAGARLPALEQPAHWLVQRCIEGEECSSFSIASRGRVLTTVQYRGAVMTGTVATCFERMDLSPDVAEHVARIVAAEAYTGFIAFDFIRGRDGIAWAIECNPRATSGVHFLEPAGLARCIIDPDNAGPPALRPQRLMQQFYPCLTETQAAVFNGGDWRASLRHLLRAKDVTWRLDDPLPFLLMPLTAGKIMLRTILGGQSFGKAATFDIQWHEPPPHPEVQSADAAP